LAAVLELPSGSVAVGYSDSAGRAFVADPRELRWIALAQPEGTWQIHESADVTVRSLGDLEDWRPLVELEVVSPVQVVDDNGYLADVDLVIAAAELFGVATALFDRTVEYAKERKQFGAPIGSFQAIQHRLADAFVELRAVESQLLYTAYALGGSQRDIDRSEPSAIDDHSGIWCAALSASAAELGMTCARNAFQLHGGVAITDELWVHRWARRSLRLALHRGSPEDKWRYVGENVQNGAHLFVDLAEPAHSRSD
jgi:hypothetical protein